MDDLVKRLRERASEREADAHSAADVRLDRAAADTIEHLHARIAELLPYAVADAQQGVALGPPPDGNAFCAMCDHACDDCVWYADSVRFMQRYADGEFGVGTA